MDIDYDQTINTVIEGRINVEIEERHAGEVEFVKIDQKFSRQTGYDTADANRPEEKAITRWRMSEKCYGNNRMSINIDEELHENFQPIFRQSIFKQIVTVS